ncbi:unnamed protein product [Adineta steineri]|uniref:Apple domain-containing protein n=1 Tax=Adineta steineri TaxID=433720 RepID=A0A819I892_9BILA|nr:unnamed protein product [Adineta steineri]CAF3910402.1 unnamed protein product [Adineta steineri]
MWRYLSVIFIIAYATIVESTCPQPKKYYIDCTAPQSLANSVKICLKYGMTLLNLTNSSNIFDDVNVLNQTLISLSCSANFWFSSGNLTGLVANTANLGTVLTDILSGLLGTLGAVLDIVGTVLACLLGGCPATTTPAPITSAIIVCTRPIQQRVIQKCLTQTERADMKTFQFLEQPMYGGILDTFPARSRATCSGLCSADDNCTESMEWFMLLLFIVGHISMIQADCPTPAKFYVDCGTTRTVSAASQYCSSHQMTLLNLTNGTSTLASDIVLLNITFIIRNCSGNFWFSSGTQLVAASTSGINNLLGTLVNLVGAVLCVVPLLCPTATTAAPIVNGFTICTRTMQSNFIQKCASTVSRSDIKLYKYTQQNMYGGVYNVLSTQSKMACISLCSSTDVCTGMSFNSGTCTLYM